jgi:uncharacterized protein
MLVCFAVANFRSFAVKQTFSLIASRRLGTAHEDHALPIPDSDDRVLRASVIYGANGAGKSNLLAALRYVRRIALEPRKGSHTTARSPFRLADLRDQPTTFDLDFITADKLYRYSLSLDDERIIEERLLHVAGNKKSLVYERHTDSHGKVEIDAPGLRKESDRLQALVTVGSRHNQSFLATARATLERSDIGKTLADVMDWLDHGLTLIGPKSTPDLSGKRLITDLKFRHFASAFLKASATGVDQLEVDKRELSKEDAQALVSKELLEAALRRVRDRDIAVLRTPNGAEVLIDRAADGEHFYRVAIQAAHKSNTRKESTFALSEESDGTQRLLHLIPALYQAESARAIHFIDEIDRSLHPLLLYKFLEYFLRRCTRTPRQVIVTTHESHVLDLDLLRRDEIWFAEKDSSGATNLYALTDFNVRKDLHVQKGYLEGRFGAVPFLGELDRLIETGPTAAPCSRGTARVPPS